MNKQIHIVCPEIPGPFSSADMTDTYFQLQFLYRAGYQAILHCFHNDPDPNITHLKNLSSCIHLYARNHGHKAVSMRHPYCISSRSNPQLLENLLQYAYPVLFQGMSSTFYLPDLVDRGYKVVVRINGIASEIYEAFIKCEKSLIKKAYSFNEARLIRKWEEKISEHATIVTTTISDKQKFQQLYKGAKTRYIAPFIPMPQIKCQPGKGMYCLYYGDLSNPENEKMVSWLSESVFNKMPVPLIVADTGNSVKPRDPLHPDSNICVVSNPAATELNELIQKAQIILLLRCHHHGFDNRLLQALEKGRYCICNDLMIHDTGLEKLFIVANEEDEIIHAINSYFCSPFTDKNIDERTHFLSTSYFPRHSLNELLEMIEQ